MLQKLRQESRSAIIYLFFGLIIFVFIFSFGAGSAGFRTGGGCGRTNVVALVNGEAITDTIFNFYYYQQLRRYMQQRDRDQALRIEDKIQLREQVMNTLVDQALLNQAAHRLGLYVTDDERNQGIRQAPQFQDENKRFNFQLYRRMVQRFYETSLTIFEEVWREQMLAERVAQIIQEATRVTEDELLQSYTSRETKIDLSFAKVPAAKFRSSITPSQTEIDEFVKNQAGRIEAAYNAASARYHKPKTVQVAQIFFETRKDYDTQQVKEKREHADLSLDDIKKGTDFAAQAKEYSEDLSTKDAGGELPPLTREAMAARFGNSFAEAAWALEPGAVSAVVETDKGFHVLKCLTVVAAEDHPLEEVQAELAKDLLITDQANAKAKAEAERILAGLAEGKKLADLVPVKPGASPADPATDGEIETGETGLFSRLGEYLPRIGVDQDMALAAFDLTKDKPMPGKVFEIKDPTGQLNYVAFRLNSRQEPDLSAFAVEKEKLRGGVLAVRKQRQLVSWLQAQRDNAQIEVNQAFLTDVAPPGMEQGKRGVRQPVPLDDY